MNYVQDSNGQWWQVGITPEGNFTSTFVGNPPASLVNPITPMFSPSTDGLQIQQTVTAPTTQHAFRQMVGILLQWNPDLPVTQAEEFIRGSYRNILDARDWYGKLIKGVLAIPALVNAGQATTVQGSRTVRGTGTAWTPALIGRQFRLGMAMPTYTIVDVPATDELALDLPWANQNFGPVGYQIFTQMVSFGANVKRLKAVLNQQMGWPCRLNVRKAALDAHDVWRTTVGWVEVVAQAQGASDGTPLWELYPVPMSQQALPFQAYIQPPDLDDDNPFPVAWIRSDVIVLGALPNALLFRGRNSKYYDPQVASWKQREFMAEIEKMKQADEAYDLKDFIYDDVRAAKPGAGYGGAQDNDSEA